MMKRSLFLMAAMISAIAATRANADLTFFSLSTTDRPNPDRLVSFNPDPSNPMYAIRGMMDMVSPSGNYMDFSPEGRLFASVGGPVLLELDPNDSTTIASFDITDVWTGSYNPQGVAVGDDGLVYIHSENSGDILEIDFDSHTVSLLMTVGFDLDQLDFDLDGNLIGFDTNQSGNIYLLPLDGSPPSVIANMPHPTVTSVAFDPIQGDLYRLGGTDAVGQRELWRQGWSNGQPVGQPEYLMDFAPSGSHAGLAVIPEPSTAVLLGAGCVLALRRRRRAA